MPCQIMEGPTLESFSAGWEKSMISSLLALLSRADHARPFLVVGSHASLSGKNAPSNTLRRFLDSWTSLAFPALAIEASDD